jgi:hypothetical protein
LTSSAISRVSLQIGVNTSSRRLRFFSMFQSCRRIDTMRVYKCTWVRAGKLNLWSLQRYVMVSKGGPTGLCIRLDLYRGRLTKRVLTCTKPIITARRDGQFVQSARFKSRVFTSLSITV